MKNLNLFPIPISKFELDPMSDEEENFLNLSEVFHLIHIY
mgnify:CR=1 FL=1